MLSSTQTLEGKPRHPRCPGAAFSVDVLGRRSSSESSPSGHFLCPLFLSCWCYCHLPDASVSGLASLRSFMHPDELSERQSLMLLLGLNPEL